MDNYRWTLKELIPFYEFWKFTKKRIKNAQIKMLDFKHKQ